MSAHAIEVMAQKHSNFLVRIYMPGAFCSDCASTMKVMDSELNLIQASVLEAGSPARASILS